MDAFLAVLFGVLLYLVICFSIALLRALFSKSDKRKENFKDTFWTLFFEVVNPFHWLG